MVLDGEIFDKETIENLQYVAAVSGESIFQISQALECVLNLMSESLENLEKIFKGIEGMAGNPTDDIPALKKQIKYCKNPMEIKILNKRLNDAYKKSKRRKK